MKMPKTTKRLCKHCKKHTQHKIVMAKKRTHGSARPNGKYSKRRTGYGHGYGNLGRYGSKPAVGSFKMGGKKTSKKTDLRYECTVCNKTSVQRKGFRAKRIEFT